MSFKLSTKTSINSIVQEANNICSYYFVVNIITFTNYAIVNC